MGRYSRIDDIMAQCPALQVLELVVGFNAVARSPTYYACITQLTALQDLKLQCVLKGWRFLLPRLTVLSLLRTLSTEYVDASRDAALVATLTQLTSLRVVLHLPHWVGCLPALTGLKRVSVVHPTGGRVPEGFVPLLKLLPVSLEGLRLRNICCGGSDEALRVISEMTRLQLTFGDRGHGNARRPWDWMFVFGWKQSVVQASR